MIRGEQSNSTRDRFGDKMDDVCKLSGQIDSLKLIYLI